MLVMEEAREAKAGANGAAGKEVAAVERAAAANIDGIPAFEIHFVWTMCGPGPSNLPLLLVAAAAGRDCD